MHPADAAVRISFREEDFQIRFHEPFRLVFFCALAVSECFFFAAGEVSYLVALVIGPAAIAALCGTAVAAMSWRYRFEIGPEGIDCYDAWCRPHRTGWNSVTGFRYVNYFGVDYLLVHNRDSRAIWLPLFVDRYDVLRDMLITYAGPKHALAEQLPEG